MRDARARAAGGAGGGLRGAPSPRTRRSRFAPTARPAGGRASPRQLDSGGGAGGREEHARAVAPRLFRRVRGEGAGGGVDWVLVVIGACSREKEGRRRGSCLRPQRLGCISATISAVSRLRCRRRRSGRRPSWRAWWRPAAAGPGEGRGCGGGRRHSSPPVPAVSTARCRCLRAAPAPASTLLASRLQRAALGVVGELGEDACSRSERVKRRCS